MITLYLRKLQNDCVSAFSDSTGLRHFVTWGKDLSNKPTKRNKYVTVNCCKYRIEWI